MTSFATAQRHSWEKATVEMSRPLSRAVNEPNVHLTSADGTSRNLSSGFNKLSNLQKSSSTRRIVSLPVLPESTSRPRTPSLFPDMLSNTTSTPPSTAPLVATPSAEDLAKLEAEKVKADREIAEVELKKYITDGVVSIKNGDNLVRFWDVRFRLVLRLTTC